MGEGAKKLLNGCIYQENHQERHVKRCHRRRVFREAKGPHRAAVVAPRSGEGASVQGDAGERAGLPAPVCLYRDLCTTHPAQFRQRREPWADAVLGRRGGDTGRARLPAPVPAGAQPGPSPTAEARPQAKRHAQGNVEQEAVPRSRQHRCLVGFERQSPPPRQVLHLPPCAKRSPPLSPHEAVGCSTPAAGDRGPSPAHSPNRNVQQRADGSVHARLFPATPMASLPRLTPPALGGQGTPGRTPRGATQ